MDDQTVYLRCEAEDSCLSLSVYLLRSRMVFVRSLKALSI
jgi:hypothetical protein